MKQITNNLWLGEYTDIKEWLSKDENNYVVYVGSDNKLKEREYPNNDRIRVFSLRDDSIPQEKIIKDIIFYIGYPHNLKMFDQKILLCCDAGISRSPYIMARIISRSLNCDMNNAYQMLLSVYPQADEETPLRLNDRKKGVERIK